MRLIDADALKERKYTTGECNGFGEGYAYHQGWNDAMDAVMENEITIEPERKKGKWIVTSELEDCCYAKCNQCNVTQIFYYGKPLTNFCPNCGCQMNGGEEE